MCQTYRGGIEGWLEIVRVAIQKAFVRIQGLPHLEIPPMHCKRMNQPLLIHAS